MLLDKFVLLFESDAGDAAKDVDKLDKGLEETKKSANSAAQGMDDANDAAESMAGSFVDAAKDALTLVAAFTALDAIKTAMTDAANYTDAMGKLADTYGWNIQQADAWGAAVERNGGSAESFLGTASSLQDQLEQIKFGGGTEIIQQLSMMGVSAYNANGQLKDSFELMESLAGSFEGMDAKRSAALGGQLGLDQSTILMLQQGRTNLQMLVDQQMALGGATQESYDASSDFNDAIDNMGRSLTAVWQTVNAKVLPAFTAIIDAMTDGIQWARKHEDFIVGGIIAIAAAITKFAIPALQSLGKAAWAALGPLAKPILIATAIGTAFALLYEDVKAYIDGHSSLIGDLADKYGWFKTMVDGLIGGFKALWQGLVDLIDWNILFAKGTFEAIWNSLVAIFDWNSMIVDGVMSAISTMSSSVIGALTSLWNAIVNLFDFSFITDSVKGIASFIGFGDDEESTNNAANLVNTATVYAQNPLNSTPTNYNYGGNRQVTNHNQFSFNNQITAKGVTSDQVGAQFNDEFGRQVAGAGSMLDDGIQR